MTDQPVQVFLSLNRPALERLLGGDGELEVTLRNQIVDEFIKQHLAEALNRKVLSDLRQRMYQVCDEVLKDYWQRGNSWNGAVTLSDSLKQRIQAAAADAIDATVQEALLTKVQERITIWSRDLDSRIRRAVDAQLNEKKINELIDTGVRERLEMAVSLCRNNKMARSIELGGGNSGNGNQAGGTAAGG
jgi:uncharacterized membrane protein YheB (UPF0754 family)